jgi:hypothetical protein
MKHARMIIMALALLAISAFVYADNAYQIGYDQGYTKIPTVVANVCRTIPIPTLNSEKVTKMDMLKDTAKAFT